MARPGRPRNHDASAELIRQAIDYSSDEEAITLIEKGDINILDGEARTPLINAALKGKKMIVSWLIEHDADINHQDRNGWSALHFAVQEQNTEVAEYLLQHGASTNLQDAYGNTPLWRATFQARGSYGMVRLLLSHKADPDLKNKASRSPMDFAVQIGDDALIQILKMDN